MDSSHFPPSPSTMDNYAYLSHITPILKLAQNLLDPIGPMSNNSLLPLFLPLPSLPNLPVQIIRQLLWWKGSIGTVSSIGSGLYTKWDADNNSRSRLSPPHSLHLDMTSTLPYPHPNSRRYCIRCQLVTFCGKFPQKLNALHQETIAISQLWSRYGLGYNIKWWTEER